ncbi:MAG: hypothetical protein WC690_02990, partial [bacterium]
MKKALIFCALIALAFVSCSKPMASAKVAKDVQYYSHTYAANANDTYYAVRWALKEVGMPVATEDLNAGIITTKWEPATSDSHYVDTFGRPDYGVTNSYHQLEVQISTDQGRSLVKVGSRIKALAARVKSSGVMER